MKKNKPSSNHGDSSLEGRDQAFMDIDRMINEGLSGGTVSKQGNLINIEEARDLFKEDPPYKV